MHKISLLSREQNPTKTRKNGQIPISIHGKNFNKQFSIDNKIFTAFVHHVGHKVLTTVFELDNNKEKILAIAKEIQIHPVTENIEHVDFLKVEKGQEFSVPVKVTVSNYEKAPFTRENGIVYIPTKNVKVLCTLDTMISEICCDISNLHKGDVIKTTDETWTKSGIKFVKKAPLVTIVDA
jgi:large subunit ribosomal protein L25